MTQKNREAMERAIGIVEGLARVAEEKTGKALVDVIEILDSVMESEGNKIRSLSVRQEDEIYEKGYKDAIKDVEELIKKMYE